MVNGVGKGGALAREALLAAMKSQARRADDVRQAADAVAGKTPGSPGAQAPAEAEFAEKLQDKLQEIDSEIQGIEEIPRDMLTGKIQDFHEVTVQIKKAEFNFRFAMEIRNKLLDAYREVMRMNV